MVLRDKPSPGRRTFLRTLGSASTLAAAAAAAPVVGSTPARAYNPGQGELRARYRADSPEVQTFYRTNGYESLTKK